MLSYSPFVGCCPSHLHLVVISFPSLIHPLSTTVCAKAVHLPRCLVCFVVLQHCSYHVTVVSCLCGCLQNGTLLTDPHVSFFNINKHHVFLSLCCYFTSSRSHSASTARSSSTTTTTTTTATY